MNTQINITAHAAQRYMERVADVPLAEARQALACRAVQTACAFGAPYVRLPSGHRVVIVGIDVVTVLEPMERYRLRKERW